MRLLIEAGLIFLIALALSIATNAIRPDGLSLKGDWSKEAIEKKTLGDDISSIALDEAHRAFENGEAFFIDARSRGEYLKGHIKGALNLPAMEANSRAREIEGLLPRDAQIITYCDGVDCPLSSELARFLKGMGYNNVRVLVNGWSIWRDAGYPVERD
jgi:rhodanese-related sulfurtransferase